MAETKHPEPWRVYLGAHVLDATGQTLTVALRDMSAVFRDPEAARRIVAAVNAVAGIPVEALESGALAKALAALGGRSGKGHNIQSSGRCDCGECHHPAGAPWHCPGCFVGAALVALGRL